jgi:uncharacterized protein with HEPN domain
MRDRLIHGYRDVDTNLVWRTVTAATLEAEDGVRRLLAQLDAESPG